MKPIRIFLPSNALDAYIYFGYIFAVFSDGTLKVLPLTRIFKELAKAYPELATVLNLAILRNDWLLNSQTATLFCARDLFDTFTSLWQQASMKKFQVELDQSKDWRVMWELPSLPIYDMRLYAMRVYLGHRGGIHEGLVRVVEEKEVWPNNGLAKVFDARTIAISARSGELIFSAGNEGLFRGSLWSNTETKNNTKVPDMSYAEKSLRTGWTGFDLINYERNSYFSYMKNETKRMSDKPRPYIYSRLDESSEKIRVSNLAVEQYPMEVVLQNRSFDLAQVQFCYNDSKSGYFFLKDGRFLSANWLNDPQKKGHLSSRYRNYRVDDGVTDQSITEKPCSALTFPQGSIIEYFDKVILIHDNETLILEDNPVFSVRTFLTSRRWKRTICITFEDGIALHTVFPTRREVSKKSFDAIGQKSW